MPVKRLLAGIGNASPGSLRTQRRTAAAFTTFYSGHSRQEVADTLSVPCESVDLHLASAFVALGSSLA
jgi:hypothetical protein